MTDTNKIVALGGKHKSASSLLAEAMSDPRNKKVIFFAFDEEGTMRYGHYDLSLANLTMALGKLLEMNHKMFAKDDE